jgi:polar amino acid transport system substrate-binding protein
MTPRFLLGVVLSSSLAFAANPPLVWGADSQGGAPYVFQDPMDPNRLVGFEVELATMLGEKLGRQARPIHGQWDKLLELLARGDFDCVINGMEVAEEKRRAALLSRPYFVAPEVLTIRKGDANAPRTLAQLSGRKIAALSGTMAERIARTAGADVKSYEGGQNEMYEDLLHQRIDGVLFDEPVAHYYGDIEEALESVRADFGEVQYAIAVRLDDAELLAQINTALETMEKDGSLRALYERWGVWGPDTAKLFGDPALSPKTPPLEYDRWRAAVGKLPPFWERLTTRYPAMIPAFLKGALLTLVVSVLAMSLAIALGISLALGRRFGPKPVQWLSVAYIEVFRGTPLLIQLIVVYFGLPQLGLRLEPFTAGVLALGLNYAAAEAENYRAGLESVPRGQVEASEVLGLSTWQTLRFVVGPQALRISIPPMTNDFIALLKDSSLVSVVTLTELTKTYGNLANSTRDHLGLGLVVAAFYLLLGLPFARLARAAERHFGRHLRKEGA